MYFACTTTQSNKTCMDNKEILPDRKMLGFFPVVLKSLSSAEAGRIWLGSTLEVLSASQHLFQACGERGSVYSRKSGMWLPAHVSPKYVQ